jgi:hypothetical protein
MLCGLASVHFQQIPTRIRLRRNFSSTNSCPQIRRHILLTGASEVDCPGQGLSVWEGRHQDGMSPEIHNPKHNTEVIFGSFARFCGALKRERVPFLMVNHAVAVWAQRNHTVSRLTDCGPYNFVVSMCMQWVD